MDNLDFLKIYETEHKKIRLGSHKDGGYVIADGLNYDILLSCGISNDTSFENDFLKKYDIKCYGFDGTIGGLPHNSHKNIQFVKKNISKDETDKTTNLLNLIENNDNIFLKMDIETWEYDWLKVINSDHLNKIKQMVIEFHFPFTYSEDIFTGFSYIHDVKYKLECLDKISKSHYLVHFHPNNCCGTTYYNGILVPNVFECTYVRKDLCNFVKNNKVSIPDKELDRVNVPENADIVLSGYPFVH